MVSTATIICTTITDCNEIVVSEKAKCDTFLGCGTLYANMVYVSVMSTFKSSLYFSHVKYLQI